MKKITNFLQDFSIDTNVGNTLSDLKSLDGLQSLSDLDTFDIPIKDLPRYFDFFFAFLPRTLGFFQDINSPMPLCLIR